MEQMLFENEFIRCELDDKNQVFIHHWLKQPTSDEFRANLLLVLESYKQYAPNYTNLKWMADTVNLGELNEDDEIWLEEEWDYRLFQEGGVKVHAVILGSDILADYPMEMFKLSALQKNHELGVHLEVFADVEKAYEWMSQF